MVAVDDVEELPPLLPPEGIPDYKADSCRCIRLSVPVRDRVERASHALILELREEKRRLKVNELPDKWYRCRIYNDDNAPMNILHGHYAGMGGRSMMGEGVGGFCLGAACPSGGLVTLAAVTYDLPWFTILLNTYLRDTQQRDLKEEVSHVECQMPDVFTCWQLNFGRNISDRMSDTCFYNPHVDKNNAKVCSIGTSFGDYEGGGVWVAHPEGNTTVNFEHELDGIYKGYVPGVVLSQKVRWLSFWAATKVHAIPPFRKNRIGVVAFSSQTGLRLTPEERRTMEILKFVMPGEEDRRFVPILPEICQVPKNQLHTLTREQLQERKAARREYNKKYTQHLKECDKVKIAISLECLAINKNRIQGVPKILPDGTVGVTVTGKISAEDMVERYERAHNADLTKIDKETEKCVALLEKLEKMSNKMSTDTASEEKISCLKEMWVNLKDTFQRQIAVGTRGSDSDTELVEYLETDNRQGGVKEDQIVSLFPTRPKFMNPPRKERKRMEEARWKQKLKFGKLPDDVFNGGSATPSSSSLSSGTLDHKKKHAAADKQQQGSKVTSTAALSPAAKKKEVVSSSSNANANAPIHGGQQINGQKKEKKELLNAVAAADAERRPSPHAAINGRGKLKGGGNVSSTTTAPTTAQNALTAAAILMASDAAKSRKGPQSSPPSIAPPDSDCILIDSDSDAETTTKDSIFGPPRSSFKRPREHDTLSGDVSKKLKNMMGSLLCQPFFPGEVVGLD